jgi:hypothetical protein
MKKWEYKYLFININYLEGYAFVYRDDGKKPDTDDPLEVYLANLGMKGWEMVGFAPEVELDKTKIMFFKRQILE